MEEAAGEEEYLSLGQRLPQAVPLPHAKGDHCWVGYEGPILGVKEPLGPEGLRVVKVLGVVVYLVEAGGDEVPLGESVPGKGGLVHGHVVHCKLK